MADQRIKSKRNKPKFINNGFLYVFDRFSSDQQTLFYRCEQKDRCKARIHVQEEEVIKYLNEHSHEPTPAKIEVDAVKTLLKTRALETQEQTAQVINECVNNNLSQAAQASMPNHTALRKLVRRQRNQINAPPPAPASLVDLVFPQHYQTININETQERFLLSDNGPSPTRIVIFGREQNIRFLEQSRTVYVDGTFKSAPPLFAQVYIVLAEVYGAVIPILYALLPNKSRQTYDSFIRLVTEVAPNMQPTRIMCDFEIAAFAALQEKFPETTICGCFFHLAQNVQKHIAQLGLRARYNNEPDFALHAKMILSLAYVPIPHLDEAVDQLSAELPNELQDLLNYFEDNYIGRPGRRLNARRPPIFPITM